MLITDEKFFCEALDEVNYPALAGIGANFKNNGLAAAEKQLCDFVRSFMRPDDYFKIPYYERENAWALGADDDFAAAEKILRGELRSCGVTKKFPDTEHIEWEANPTYNEYREWTWQLSRHHEWRCLGWCYRQTGDEKYAKGFVDFLMSWCEQAPCPENVNPYLTKCWRTIEAGIRQTKNWHYAFHAFLKSPHMTDHVMTTYLKSIWEHGYRLRNFSSMGNWLIMEMAGLSHIAMLYPFIKETSEWGEYAFRRLSEEIDVQVYPDGFQYELTTNYHGVVVQNYYWVINTAKAIGYDIPDYLSTNLLRLFELFTYIAQPDGKQPNLNDGGRQPVDHWLQIGLSYFPDREDFKWFATNGKEGTPPAFKSIALPYSGMAIMRTGWEKDAVWCFMESAPFGKAHQHEDKLNVLMQAYGKEVLPDAGSYSYDTSEMRKFILDTRAHNCALVDDMSQNRRAGYKWEPEMIKERSNLSWGFTASSDTAEGVYDEGYGPDKLPATHARKVIFFKKGLNGSLPFAVVIDRLTSGDGKPHKFAVSYQMNVQPYTVEGSTYTADHGDGVTMSIIGSQAPNVIVAQKTPIFIGWRPRGGANSEDFEHYHAPCLSYEGVGMEKKVATVLYPSNNGEVAVKAVEISEELSDTKFTLTFADGSKVTLDEKDYPASGDAEERFI